MFVVVACYLLTVCVVIVGWRWLLFLLVLFVVVCFGDLCLCLVC